MRPLQVADAETSVLGLQDEIRRSEESRYDHRLHGVLLVAQGMTCPEVGRLLGDAPRSVEYWVRRFEERGLAGLAEGQRSGRPRRLSEAQMEEVDPVLLHHPTRKSVGYFGAVRLRDGRFFFRRETGKFNALTCWQFLKDLRAVSTRTPRRAVVIADNAKYHHARLHREWRQERAERF